MQNYTDQSLDYALSRLINARTPEAKRYWWHVFKIIHKRRTPEEIKAMEVAKGLSSPESKELICTTTNSI